MEPEPPIAAFLRQAGWPDDAGKYVCRAGTPWCSRASIAGSVLEAAVWLNAQGIHCDVDFCGLCDLALLPGAELLSARAVVFLESLTSDAAARPIVVHVPREAAPTSALVSVGLCQGNAPPLDVSSCTPSEALKRLRDAVDAIGQENWTKRARQAAILGNCPKSLRSMRSGARVLVPWFMVHAPFALLGLTHWLKYVEIVKGKDAMPFPVCMDDVLGWSLTFR